MNFFQAQAKADEKTSHLLLAFGLGTVILILIINAFVLSLLAFFTHASQSNESFLSNLDYHFQSGTWIGVSISILVIVLAGFLYQAYKIRKGGKSVMEDLGARLLLREGASLEEKVLLNVVEEISIASGVPPPAVYTLKDDTINAFASGFSVDDATICVTQGCIKYLKRSELQGVVAHEFSHIFNGDMNLFMKTSSMIYGILAIGVVGSVLLRSAFSAQPRRKKDKSDAGVLLFLIVLGLGLMFFGYVGMFIGTLIKASISRQREFAADATAVKYTRDTSGIANALKKVFTQGGKIEAENAENYSHFYFAKGISHKFFNNLLSTHPPLSERILKIDPLWDGKYVTLKNEENKKSKKDEDKKEKLIKILTTSMMFDALDNAGIVTEENLKNARDKIEKIPNALIHMSQSPFTAQALVLALLSSDIHEVPQEVISDFSLKNPKLSWQIKRALGNLADLKREDYVTLLLLCIPSLKTMSLSQYKTFKDILLKWIWANQRIVLFEWIVKRVILSPLDIYFELTKPSNKIYKNLVPINAEASYFLSFMCQHGVQDKVSAKTLFDKVVKAELNDLNFITLQELDFIKFGTCLDKLTLADATIKKQLIHASISILNDDKILSTENHQILQTLSLTLKIPLPSL